jgi:ribonucleoside-diphosphate reductase beta chain
MGKVYNKSSSLYIPEYIDYLKQPMFLGKGLNTQRFDILKYPFFDEKNGRMQGFDWNFDEVKLTEDYIDFNQKMEEHEKFIYTRVLQRLIFLDSLQGRGILSTLGLIVTLPEVENALLTWQYFEGAKHSKTYTENLKGVYNNPKEIFDESFEIPELMENAKSISEPYNEAYEAIIEYEYKIIKDKEITEDFLNDLKRKIVKLVVTINILEGVRFYSGFSCIWALNKGQGLVPGTSKNLKLICRDENQHLALTQKILLNFKRIDSEGFKDVFQEMKNDIIEMYKQAYEEEKSWIEYLFSKGSIIGLNAQISIEYLEYTINRRLKAIGLPIMFKSKSKNPIRWIEEYIYSDEIDELPQESEIINYVSRGVDKNQDKDLTEFMSLI